MWSIRADLNRFTSSWVPAETWRAPQILFRPQVHASETTRHQVETPEESGAEGALAGQEARTCVHRSTACPREAACSARLPGQEVPACNLRVSANPRKPRRELRARQKGPGSASQRRVGGPMRVIAGRNARMADTGYRSTRLTQQAIALRPSPSGQDPAGASRRLGLERCTTSRFAPIHALHTVWCGRGPGDLADTLAGTVLALCRLRPSSGIIK